MYSKLQYISQGATAKEQLESIQHVLDAGGKWIQLRFKTAQQIELIKLADRVKNICSLFNAVFIVNDHADIAKKVDADGVHLGLQDMPTRQARKILGDNKIIGGTANTLHEVMLRVRENCNYIGLGPFRFTTTKENLSPVLGLKGYKNISREIAENNIQIPVYGIGGILLEDVDGIIKTGLYGIAVSGALTNYANKKEWIEKVNALLHCESA